MPGKEYGRVLSQAPPDPRLDPFLDRRLCNHKHMARPCPASVLRELMRLTGRFFTGAEGSYAIESPRSARSGARHDLPEEYWKLRENLPSGLPLELVKFNFYHIPAYLVADYGT